MFASIPEAELEIFKKLNGLKVIFDVGAREDMDYIDLCPKAIFHLFEPNPEFFKELNKKVDGKWNVYINNYGLGHKTGMYYYGLNIQAFVGGDAEGVTEDLKLKIRTLDSYVKSKQITKIDFLKIDTEGYDYNVLLGGKKSLKLCKYIQYEHWNDKQKFHDLLESDFDMEYIGYRNVLCMNKKKVLKKERDRLIKFIRDNNFAELR